MVNYNENTPLPLLAKELRKRVGKLLLVYYSLIIGTILFSVSIIFLSAGIIVFFIMKGYDMVAFQIGALPLILSIMIGIASIDAILTPLLSLMRPKKLQGKEIFKKDNPELFSLIEDVVKQSDCKMPRHIFITDDCNAHVSYANIGGYIFANQHNLTIGIPLLMPLNKTELEFVLAHEFGHFSQKSIAINRIANLSEFICSTIGETYNAYEKSNYEFDQNVKFFAKITYNIMLRQYQKVAPLNAILSRAQELDADRNAMKIAGVDAAVSALNKVDYMSIRWNNFINVIEEFIKEGKVVSDIIQLWECYNYRMEEIGEQILNADTPIIKPKIEYHSRITRIHDYNTHPTIGQRCDILKEYYRSQTIWNNTPVISLFNLDYVKYLNDTIIEELKVKVFKNTNEVLNGNVVSIEEFNNIVEGIIPEVLECFYSHNVFFSDDTTFFDKTSSDHIEFPFTDYNAQILREYYVAYQDMVLLRDIMEDNSADLRYLYNRVEYSGQDVPLDKHTKYLELLSREATDIALRCNMWLCRNSDKYEIFQLVDFYCEAFNNGEAAMEAVHNISKNGDNSTKAKEYVKSVNRKFKEICTDLINLEDGKIIEYIFDVMNINREDRQTFFYFCMQEIDDDVQVYFYYRFINNIIVGFFKKVKIYMLRNIVLPKMIGANH